MTGRVHDLRGLTASELDALAELRRLFARRPTWSEFACAWPVILQERVWGPGPVPVGSTLYRVAQDLECRLGVAHGDMAPEDHRGRILDLIEERFGTRYAFCMEVGIDQGHLSRVLYGDKEFSLPTLRRVFEALGVQLDCIPIRERERESRALASDDGTEDLRDLTLRIATLDDLAARARALPLKRRASLVPDADPRAPDDLTGLRARLAAGERFDAALTAEVADACAEQAELARRLARRASARAKAERTRAAPRAKQRAARPRSPSRRGRTKAG